MISCSGLRQRLPQSDVTLLQVPHPPLDGHTSVRDFIGNFLSDFHSRTGREEMQEQRKDAVRRSAGSTKNCGRLLPGKLPSRSTQNILLKIRNFFVYLFGV